MGIESHLMTAKDMEQMVFPCEVYEDKGMVKTPTGQKLVLSLARP